MKLTQFSSRLAALALFSALSLPLAPAFAASGQAFKTPEAAMEAFGAALKDDDEKAKETLLGSNFRKFIPPQGAEIRYRFLENWAQSPKLLMEGEKTARIAVGDSGWTLPIPLVKTAKGWQFDLVAGKKEMTVREIGRNELAAMRVAKAFVEAQREFFAADFDGDGQRTYAPRIVSTPGKQDGLYWPDAAGQPQSPMGPLLAQAAAEGKIKQPGNYHGYRYRILDAQGPSAPGGARSYFVDQHMTGGFALLLWPAVFGETGIMTFMVNQEGQVFETNLGPKTAEKAARIQRFDPDSAWRKVDAP